MRKSAKVEKRRPSVAERMIQRLQDFSAALESGAHISQRYTCGTVARTAAPTAYHPRMVHPKGAICPRPAGRSSPTSWAFRCKPSGPRSKASTRTLHWLADFPMESATTPAIAGRGCGKWWCWRRYNKGERRVRAYAACGDL